MTCRRYAPAAAVIVAALVVSTAGVWMSGTTDARAANSDLLFSEYVEGSSNNKALEIYNGTGRSVTLDGAYDVQIFANGSPTATSTIALAGTLDSGATFVLSQARAAPALLAAANQLTSNFLFNGNDALALRHAGIIIDVIGQIGVDPGEAWGSGELSTKDTTLRRNPAVMAGDIDGTDPFEPAAGWTGWPSDTFTGLGEHTAPAVNRMPQPEPDALSLDEDALQSTVDVLANDSDPDGDPLTVLAASADRGFASPTTLGDAVVYTPAPDFNGQDVVTYTVADPAGASATATVAVTVLPINDSPNASPDSVVVRPGITELDVLQNDTDPDGDSLTVRAVTQPANGKVMISASRTAVAYESDPGYIGTDRFTYDIADAAGATARATVELTVARPAGVDPCAHKPTLTGTPGRDILVGTPSDDVIHGVGDHDLILGRGGDDLICSGPQGDVIITRDGNDTIVTSDGHDLVISLDDDDVIHAHDGNDRIHAGAGDDQIMAGDGRNVLRGGDGDDHIVGGRDLDRIDGGRGLDTCDGGAGRNRLWRCEERDQARVSRP